MWAVSMIPTVFASQDCSSGRFGPGGRPCPEPQIQYGVGLIVVIGVVALALAALWWWAVMRRYRPGQRLLPRVWWLLIGWSVLGAGAVGALFVLADQPLAKAPSAGADSIVMGALTWIVVVGALIWVLMRDRPGHRPQRTAEEVWNDTDPEFRKGSWKWWQGPFGGGAGP